MNKNHSENQSGLDPRSNDVDLKELNRRHLSSIDKFYRMCAGAGSEITAFEDSTIYLTITVDDRQQPPFHDIVGKIAQSWLHEEELKNASQYVGVIFQTDGRLGALVNPRAGTLDQLAHRVVKLMPAATKPDVPIGVISGEFR